MFVTQSSENPPIKEKSLIKLLILAVAGFLGVLSEAIPAGMLYDISSDLSISISQAGQLVSYYAAGCTVSAIPLSILTRNFDRRFLLLIILIFSSALNFSIVMSSDYYLILILRFLTGFTGGLLWSTLSGYARSMVSIEKKGRAVAIAYSGVPIALALGIPLGTFLVTSTGWKIIFAGIAVLTLLTTLLTLKFMPKVKMHQNKMLSTGRRILSVLKNPAMLAVLLINLLWAISHNMLYTFVLPVLSSLGLGEQSGGLLMNFGMSSIFGMFIVGLFIDKNLPALTLIFLSFFLFSSTIFLSGSISLFMITFSFMLWGSSYGGASALLPAASAEASKEDADIAQSVLSTVYNLSLTVGGVVGGTILSQGGTYGLCLMVFCLAALALALAELFKRRGFLKSKKHI